MRLFIGTLTLVLLLCLFAGCKKNEPPVRADLRTRLEAAMQISNSSDRDSALKAVAVAAADLGAGDIVMDALGHTSSTTFHDEAANECAFGSPRPNS